MSRTMRMSLLLRLPCSSGQARLRVHFFTMIGTIRKHSAWLWWSIIPLTIISFVFFMGKGPSGSGGRGGGYGTIYGKEVTAEEFAMAQREFYIYYWLHYGELPDKNPNFNRTDLERETYVRLMLTAKAKALGIHVSEDALVAGANDLLRSLGRNGQTVPMSQLLEHVLQPEGLDAADFQRFVRDDLTIQQLVQTLGLSGALVTPQEAGQLYDREHQEVSAQAVFFSASNYLAQVTVTPAAVAQFYTNNMAVYREPDRVQVNYVAFDLTNFFAAAEQKLGKTNITSQAEAYYAQHGTEAVPDAKTPEEAKAKIREMILRQGAQVAAAEAGQGIRHRTVCDGSGQPGKSRHARQEKRPGRPHHRAVRRHRRPGRIFRARRVHQNRVQAECRLAVLQADSRRGSRLCHRAGQTIAQRDSAARPDSRPRGAGFSIS